MPFGNGAARRAAQPAQLCGRRRAAALVAGGRISGGVGAWLDDELAGYAGFCGCCVWPGRVDQPTADEWRFAVNRTGFRAPADRMRVRQETGATAS